MTCAFLCVVVLVIISTIQALPGQLALIWSVASYRFTDVFGLVANTAQVPETLIADAGYWSEENA